MDDMDNQMGLFEIPKITKQPSVTKIVQKAVVKPTVKQPMAKKPAKGVKPSPAKVSGLVPEGDVRLTANIRQDLHLKLKIAAAHKRTTIGEIIEDLIDKHVR